MFLRHQRGHTNTDDNYHLDPRNVAAALGGDVTGRNTVLVPGPGHSRHDRSLRVYISPDAPRGFRVHSFCGEDPIYCRDYVAEKLGLPAFRGTESSLPPRINLARVKAAADRDAEREAYLKRADLIWQSSKPIQRGSLADRYFRQRLGGHVLPEEVINADQLRFHPSYTGNVPGCAGTIVARMVDTVSGDFVGVSRIFIDIDARKIGRKKMLGGSGIVRLCGMPMQRWLAVGEGIETCLAAMILYDLAAYPIMACLTADNLAKFPIVPGVEQLHIFADHDASGTGEKAAIECGLRWLAAGKVVRGFMPAIEGKDIADLMDEESK